MGERRRIHLFGEDIAHERFISALLERIASEENVEIHISTGSAQGGHGRALAELRTHQRAVAVGGGIPDLLVVAVDANCQPWARAKSEISTAVNTESFPAHALAIPDPHIERWYISDPLALKSSLGAHVTLERRKCERDEYKRILVSCLRAAGHPVTLGGAEFAREIVEAMDLFRSGKNEPSLKHFLDQARGAVKSW